VVFTSGCNTANVQLVFLLMSRAGTTRSQDKPDYGADDRPPCAKCSVETFLSRRTPHPTLGVGYELQTFTCFNCGDIQTRAADQHGAWPHIADTVRTSAPLDPHVADLAPIADVLTDYDRQHMITYLRLLDAQDEGVNWTDVARVVLQIDPTLEPERARRAWETHLARAIWMVDEGYRHLVRPTN
jgi:Uncharacterized conserved protein (DUF2285)